MNETNLTTEIKTEPNIGNRFAAGIVDYIIIFGVTFFLVFILREPNDAGGYSLHGLPGLIPIVFWLIMTVGLEVGFGSTAGNYLVGLKPIPKSGTNRKLTFKESFKRHLLDPIDMLFFGLVGIVTIKNTELNQRVGDLWAKTIVVPIKSLSEIKMR
ncbi:RDD family protein [Polaribacter undariae]|uniref:RDD family protein n=1 Tax=Polaribacter sejongensis TaxID=985043 RepID=A0AAJ1QUV1_9FLAO|nr:RDD family protein [Polaribacter undariae]MDN3618683.1 RDD family protein [Polaribacter undariae]UWD30338.1 RDD family protein [Polaribacter undariae]